MRTFQLITFFVSVCFVKGVILPELLLDTLAPRDATVVRVRELPQNKDAAEFFPLDFIGLVKQYGYAAEAHQVTTDDGYNLIFFRITYSPLYKGNNTEKPIVFLQHGLVASADFWMLQDPSENLSLLLADSGYDVWIGNVRGNSYCRSHVYLSTSDHKFWNFSYHEHAIYDIPKMIDYILAYTNSRDLFYIGHSMGTTIMYVMLSMRPAYNSKIRLGISLAPIAYWNFDTNPLIKNIIPLTENLEPIFAKHDVYDALPQVMLYSSISKYYCSDVSKSQSFCVAALNLFFGEDGNYSQLNTSKIPYYFRYTPAGASIKSLFHYTQNIKAVFILGLFQRYDYGFKQNIATYGKAIPPQYDLTKISTPIVLYHGLKDILSSKSNILSLRKNLPNVVTVRAVPFSHLDFVLGIEAREYVYNHILTILKQY